MKALPADRAAPTVTLAHDPEGDRLVVHTWSPRLRERLVAAGFVPRRDGVLVAPRQEQEVPPCR